MKSAQLAAAALLGIAAAPAGAQYQQPYPAAPVQQPLATQASVSNLDNRVVALEQQLAQLIRLQEENGHRIVQLEGQLKQARDSAAERIAAVEAELAAARAAPVVVAPAAEPAPEKPRPAVASSDSRPKPIAAVAAAGETDPAEEAYDSGYQLWKAGKYDEAIGALRAFTSAYPSHRRTSWANNLAGRAMLDKGEARAAAEALLANYRSNPKGERAADSLYYLGQALLKLGQPSQACKAYAELESVYGDKVRGEIKGLLPKAKSQAKCGA